MLVKQFAVGSCVAVLAVGLLAGGCTPESGPTPTTEPSPRVSSPTPPPTPAENEQERQQRLDFEAAEKAYLTADAEVNRLGQAGGASKPTKVLVATTAGEYLDVQMEDLKTLKENDWRTDRSLRTSVSANGGWSPNEISLTACEDASQVKLLDKANKEVAKDRDRRFVQTLTATKVNGAWKITGIESEVVKSFANESGCQL